MQRLVGILDEKYCLTYEKESDSYRYINEKGEVSSISASKVKEIKREMDNLLEYTYGVRHRPTATSV